ncbi:MAG: hypothetical protein RIT37_1368 [Bacteroidota bacterium]|jgi:hypothetical protein
MLRHAILPIHVRLPSAEKISFRFKIGVDANHEKNALIVDDDKFRTTIHH